MPTYSRLQKFLCEAVTFSANQKEKPTKGKGELTQNPEIAELLS